MLNQFERVKRINAVEDLQENSPINQILINNEQLLNLQNLKRSKKSTPLIKVI